MSIILFIGVCLLAYSNGANDNFKGVATLAGSGTTDYRKALTWATIMTFAGALLSIFLAEGLLKAFSGKGLVPTELTAQPHFLIAVGLGAAATVMIATVTGFPISTTHALIGALVGAGLAIHGGIHWDKLGKAFLMPLAVSPLLSCLLTASLYPMFRFARRALKVERRMCLCVKDARPRPVTFRPDGSTVFLASGQQLTLAQQSQCEQAYLGRILGFDSQKLLDKLHYLSSGMVCFARGLNDTPKIVALLIAGQGIGLPLPLAMLLVGIVMVLGGILQARKVAHTMSHRITGMNHGQGFTANLVTAVLVTLASRIGVPVSTTHVSCGSLFGLGAVTRQARTGVIGRIFLSWLITLPLGATLAALTVFAFRTFFS